MTFLHRYYERNYVSKYGNAFGENSRNANEKGLYAGLNVKILPDLNSVFYVDVFRFPWLSYNVDGPSVGAEMLFHISYNFSENTQVYFRYKKDNKERNNQHIHLSGISATKMNRYRIHFQSAITENLAWKNRLEVSHYQEDGSSEAGWLFYQDFKYIIEKLPLTSHLRYAIFDTESYATRIYAYEHDVRYAFSIPAYYSNGIRVYWKVHYTLSDFDFYFKVGQTRYFNKDEIGSGLNLINGNTKTDLKFQVIYQF
jgi:hypothetical protein